MELDKQEILRQLDTEAESFVFPMLDNGYYYHGDQKLTIFRDEKRWAILIEILAYNNHEYGIEGIMTVGSVFGNCLIGWNDNDCFKAFASDNGVETFLYDEANYIPYLNPNAKSINIRGQEIPVVTEYKHYRSKGIEFEHDGKITPWEFMRSLIPEYSNYFWWNKTEISTKIPSDLPVFMTLTNWHHPNLLMQEKPSDTQTFQQLADVIVSGDIKMYKTNESHNTHWTNWPEGGKL